MNIFSTLGALLISTATYPLGMVNISSKEIPFGTERATILVHGFAHNQSAWYYIKHRLKCHKKLGPIITLNLGHPFQSIESYAKKLQAQINAVKRLSGNEKLEINLVGHSMGGLVCTRYATHYASQDFIHVSKIVTIASPLQGTSMAQLAKPFCRCAAEMLPGSEFLLQLQNEARCLKGTTFYHIGCGCDFVVDQKRTYFKDHPNDYAPAHLGHFSALYSPSVAGHMIQFLLD